MRILADFFFYLMFFLLFLLEESKVLGLILPPTVAENVDPVFLKQ